MRQLIFIITLLLLSSLPVFSEIPSNAQVEQYTAVLSRLAKNNGKSVQLNLSKATIITHAFAADFTSDGKLHTPKGPLFLNADKKLTPVINDLYLIQINPKTPPAKLFMMAVNEYGNPVTGWVYTVKPDAKTYQIKNIWNTSNKNPGRYTFYVFADYDIIGVFNLNVIEPQDAPQKEQKKEPQTNNLLNFNI